jgi:hypothetical protein
MPAKLRHALGVLLILFIAASAGGVAAMDFHELLDSLRTKAPRLMAGPAMFSGFIAAGSLVLLAGLIIDANLVRRAPAQASLTAVKWILGGAVALLLAGPVLGQAFLNDQLHQAGYVPCGADAQRRFRRTEWVLPDQPCTPQADR